MNMKNLGIIFLSLVFISGCGQDTATSASKKDTSAKSENKQELPKETWIHNSPWGKNAFK